MEEGSRIEVREATAADCGRITVLCEQLGYPATEAAVAARLESLRGLPEHVVLVAGREGAVAGWLHVATTHALVHEAFAEILGLVVDAAERGSGIGAALVAAAETWARERGVHEMRVRSRDTRERAHRFYQREGYEAWKRQIAFRKTLVPVD